MEIVPLTKKLYSPWDKFALTSDDAWFWHTTDWLEYLSVYGATCQSKSLSFLIKSSSEILAIAPLVISQNKKKKEFVGKGFPIDVPALANSLNIKMRLQILKLAFDYIDELARRNNLMKALFKISPETKNFLYQKTFRFNFLKLFDFIDISNNTQILELKKPKTKLWLEVKKKQRYEIKKGEKEFKIKIFTNQNISLKTIKTYQKLHQKAAGRKTRSSKTFHLMFNWVKKKKAILLSCLYKEKTIGFILLNTYKSVAYYHSACNDPEFRKKPIGHFLQWTAIKWLKANNFKFYNIGEQKLSSQIHSLPSPKEKDISYFKSSFGGQTFPFFIGEKYYDAQYFTTVYNKRVKKYTKTLEENLKAKQK